MWVCKLRVEAVAWDRDSTQPTVVRTRTSTNALTMSVAVPIRRERRGRAQTRELRGTGGDKPQDLLKHTRTVLSEIRPTIDILEVRKIT